MCNDHYFQWSFLDTVFYLLVIASASLTHCPRVSLKSKWSIDSRLYRGHLFRDGGSIFFDFFRSEFLSVMEELNSKTVWCFYFRNSMNRQGECYRHAMVCGAGIGVFLMLRVSLSCELYLSYFVVVLQNSEQREGARVCIPLLSRIMNPSCWMHEVTSFVISDWIACAFL
jgi:hypothetical protein